MLGVSQPFIDWSWIGQNQSQIVADLVQHIELSLIAVAVGTAISIPLAVLSWRFRLLRAPVTGIASALYIVPSVALFGILGPVTGYFSTLTAEVALVGYTILILVMNTLAGLAAVPPEARDAARAMGYSPAAALWRVEMPLALPYMFAGLRVATVTVVGLVTVTTFIGLGGLGQLFIAGFQGSSSGPFYTPILVGLVLSVALAATADLLIVLAEKIAVPWTRSARRPRLGAA